MIYLVPEDVYAIRNFGIRHPFGVSRRTPPLWVPAWRAARTSAQ